MVDSLEMVNEGKTIHICLTTIGTPMKAVSVQEWSNPTGELTNSSDSGSDMMVRKTFVSSGYTNVHLGNNNQIIKIVRYQEIEQEE